MKKFGIISALAIAALFTSCNEFTVSMDETQQVESKNLVFSAKIGDVATKTAIDGVKVKWEEGDEIAINGSIYVAQVSPKDPTMASFIVKEGQTPVEEMGVEEYYAVYPATSYVDAGMVSVSNEQVFNGASLANVNPMFAHTTSTTLDFHNVCGLLAFNLLGENSEVLKSVTVSQPFDEERESNPKLAGMVNAFMEDGEVVVEPSMLWFDSITISFENHPLQLSGETQTIYVAVPAQTYPELVITVNTVDQDARFEYVATKAATVKRNTIHRLTFQTNIKTLEEATVAIEELEKQFTMVYNTTVNGEDYTTGNTYSLVVEEYTTKINEIANAIEAIKAFRDEHYEAGNLGENLDEIGMKIEAVQESLTEFLNDFAEAVAAVDAAFEELTMAIEDEQGALTALMMLTIYNEEYSDELYTELNEQYAAVCSAIEQNIEAIQQWALESYEAGTIIADSEEIIEALEGTSPNSIMMQINSAASGYQAAAAEISAYAAFAVEFDNLQQQWTMVYNATVGNKDYEDEMFAELIEEMTPVLSGIQQQLQALQTWADESYEAGTLAADLEEIFSNFEGIQIMLTQFYNLFNDTVSSHVYFDLSVKSVSYDGAEFTVKVSNEDAYFFLMLETAGYVASFESAEELMQAELDYWYSQYGTSYSKYGYDSYNELLLEGICDQGSGDYTFSKRNPETDYVCYLFAIDPETLEPISDLYTAAITTEAKPFNWTLLGVGKYQEGFLGDLFGLGTKEIDVEIYKSTVNPNLYAMKNPYGPDMQVDWWYNSTITKDMLVAAEGQVWKETLYEFTINGSKVAIDNQELGIYVNANIGVSYQGWPAAGCSAAYGMTGGTYSDGVITIPTRGAVIEFPEVGKAYYANTDGNFKITMPTSEPTKAPAAEADKNVHSGIYMIKGFDINSALKLKRNNLVEIR